jgi:undecaprenyl-diphosphatase
VHQAVILGVVQGLTEFVPVSSSGHLLVLPRLLGWRGQGTVPSDLDKAFGVALHVGTFAGAAAYLAGDLCRLARTDRRLAWLLLLSSVPGAVVGAGLESLIEDRLGDERLVAALCIAFGLALAVADRSRGARPVDDFGSRDAAALGALQALALAPGVSRSGITITGARALGFDRDTAARLSFLMSLPIIGGAALYKGLKAFAGPGPGLPDGVGTAFVAGTAASAITGAAAVWGTLRYVRSHSFTPFVAYRVAAGAAVLAWLARGRRAPAEPRRWGQT